MWANMLGRVFGRMIASLPDRIEIAPQDLLARVEFDPNGAAEVSPVLLDSLAKIISHNQTIRMKYRPLGAPRPREYTVDPYVLRRMRGAWYLAARDHRSGHVPLFNLMRIGSFGTTGQTFDYQKSGFNPADYFKNTFGAFETKDVHHVAVEFTGTAAKLVQERRWHSSQKLTPQPRGRLKFEVDISHLDDILPWILSWGRQAKVLSPQALKKTIAAEAASVMCNYWATKKACKNFCKELEH
ncbi:MAG: WYL domain-containing protein [Planctomycetaceae bacterium]